MTKLILYIRLGCHLCDSARKLLIKNNIECTLIDVDESPELKSQYDSLVPVLYHCLKEKELIYPFSEKELMEFL